MRRAPGVPWLAALSGLALLATPGPCPAQSSEAAGPAVRTLRLQVEAGAGGSPPRLELDYRLRVPPEVGEIPLRGLAFGGTEIAGVEAWVDGSPVEVRLRPDGRLLTAATVPLPEARGEGRGAGRGSGGPAERSLRLAYRVEDARGPSGGASFDLRLPVLRVDWEPTSSEEGTFAAEMRLPLDARVTERLPTVPMTRSAAGSEAVYRFTLPAVPSVLRFRGRTGPAPALTLGRWVDLAVLAVLALVGLLGWRAFRRA